MLRIRVEGVDETTSELRNLSNSVTNFQSTGIWQSVIDDFLIREIKTVFSSDGYGGWARRLDNLPHPLLRKTGRLFKSYTEQDSPDNITQISPRRLTYGTSLFYSDYLEQGTSRMVARKVLGLLVLGDVETRLSQFIDNKLTEKIGR